MNTPEKNHMAQELRSRAVLRQALSGLLILGFLPGLILFLAAGTTDWWQAWLTLGFGMATNIASRIYLVKRYPDLALERARWNEAQDAKAADYSLRDRRLVPMVAIYGPLLFWLAAGLDRRFGWSASRLILPAWLNWLGFGLMAGGYLFAIWAMLVNRFFSAVVRIQTERGHKVVDHGPYHFVRHPAYAGGILAWIGTPLLLGTLWAWLPAGLTSLLILLRTGLEDQALKADLPGYSEYASRVRYRIFPGIW